jgi:hypothetical protein
VSTDGVGAPGSAAWTVVAHGATRGDVLVTMAERGIDVRHLVTVRVDGRDDVDEACGAWIIERDGLYGFPDRPVVTVWWDGSAR